MYYLNKYIAAVTTCTVFNLAPTFASSINTSTASHTLPGQNGSSESIPNIGDEASAKEREYLKRVFLSRLGTQRFEAALGSRVVNNFIKTLDPCYEIALKKWAMLADMEVSFEHPEKRELIRRVNEWLVSLLMPQNFRYTLLRDDIEGLHNILSSTPPGIRNITPLIILHFLK
jgi:hypothetical protein